MRTSLAWLLACVAWIGASAQAAAPSVEQIEPRAYGWFVGDQFDRRIVVVAPAGFAIDPESLPRPVRQGQFIELRRIEVTQSPAGAGDVRHVLDLRYQVFLAPTAVRTLEIPPFTLKLRQGAAEQTLRVEAWPITVAPLVPEAVSPRRGLGDLQPDAALPEPDMRAAQRRLVLIGVAALLPLGYLAWAWWLGPWWALRHRPFHGAWRQLRSLPAGQDGEAWRVMHRALDASAGHALFEHDLDAWLAARPDAQPLREELQRFFRRSREIFFADAPAGDRDWLLSLARRLRALERGT